MGNAASGAITHRYHVRYVNLTDPERGERETTVALTSGYTAFEDIRKIVRMSIGVKVEDIDIVSVTLLPVTVGPPAERTGAAWKAYVAALRSAQRTDLADLMDGLNARTWDHADGDPGDTSPRYVVELFGLIIDVRDTKGGLVVDLRTDTLDAKYLPVNVNLGDAALTDDGRWTTRFAELAGLGTDGGQQ